MRVDAAQVEFVGLHVSDAAQSEPLLGEEDQIAEQEGAVGELFLEMAIEREKGLQPLRR